MLNDDDAVDLFARTHAVNPAAAREFLRSVADRAGAARFYVFWSGGGGGSASGGRTGRPRTLLAFPSADAALAFAQRNQLAGPAARPRLRQLALLHLLQVLIGEPAIVALLLVSDDAPDDLPPGRLPDGLRLERADVLRKLGLV